MIASAKRPALVLRFLLPLLLAAFAAAPAAAQCAGLPGCVLAFADEFDGTALDLGKWTPQLGDGTAVGLPPGWGNNELQYYQAENATVAGGYLTITAQEDAVYGYTSARLRTLGKADFTFGRVEMRAKMPIGRGLWPAFWMLPTDSVPYGTWAAGGEIDVTEYLGHEPAKISGSIHFGGIWPYNVFSTVPYTLASGTFHDDFHVFAIEWEAGEIRWYVDGNLYATQNEWFSTGGPFPAPFDADFHILVNLAVGGFLPGPPDATTVFPQTLVVDYVRVYQIPDAAPSVAITSPADGAWVAPGTDLVITADATDDGAVAVVELYQGAAKLGEDSTAPYELTVPGVAEGCYTLRARVRDDAGYVGNSDAVAVTVGSTCAPAPYRMRPAAIPGTIEAESFDLGGEGVAYSDSDSTNDGGRYRLDEGVDVEGTMDDPPGENVRHIVAGEWLAYTVDVAAAGTYHVGVRVASESAGGSFRLEFAGVDKTGAVSFASTGGGQSWSTVSVAEVALGAGVQTMRVVSEGGDWNLNRIVFGEAQPCTGKDGVPFDDMEHGNPWASGWFTFGGAVGGGGIGGNDSDLAPDGGSFSLGTGWGSGGNPGDFGGFGRTFPVDLSGMTHFNFWINPDAGQDYTLGINLQDDDNGDNGIPWPPDADDDEFQYDCHVGPEGPCATSGGGWQLVSISLADFYDDNSYLWGGNGVLDPVSVANGGNGQLINVVVAVYSHSGADVTFRTDDWRFVDRPSEVLIDDLEHGNPWGSGWFGFNGSNGGGGFGPTWDDLPPAFGGGVALATGWGGGGWPGFYGGFGRTFPVVLYTTDHFGFWLNPDAGQDFTLEVNLQDDDNADGAIPSWPPDGLDDEFQFNCVVSPTGPCATSGGGWQFVSIPLADFFDDGSFHWGGNGVLDAIDPAPPVCGNGKLINVLMVVISNSGADATFRTDYWTFTVGSLDAEYDRVPDEIDNCPAAANPDQADLDGDGQGDVCDPDDDGDGVDDGGDLCAATPAGELVDGDGCSIAQLCPCDGAWANHGAYVSCVAHAAEAFVGQGVIGEAEQDAVVAAAAESACGK